MAETIDFLYNPDWSHGEKQRQLDKFIDKIQKDGGKIISGEPIEEIIVKVTGRKFVVEKPDKTLTIKIEMPKACGVCPFYREAPYQCHNESGYECGCTKGYMDDHDMRDRNYKKCLYPGCKLSEEAQA